MTNAEKYKEVFGLEPDITSCPTFHCEECPLYNLRPTCDMECHTWWNSEYKENKV